MNRKDKQIIDRGVLESVIHQSEICHLACSINDQPYVIPISFGYDGQKIYIHSAKKGKKIDILTQNPQVCLAFESQIKLIKNPDQACEWSFEFASVIINGEAKVIEDPEEKSYALNQIMLHYSGKSWHMPEDQVKKTIAWAISIGEITGKGNLTL